MAHGEMESIYLCKTLAHMDPVQAEGAITSSTPLLLLHNASAGGEPFFAGSEGLAKGSPASRECDGHGKVLNSGVLGYRHPVRVAQWLSGEGISARFRAKSPIFLSNRPTLSATELPSATNFRGEVCMAR
jgi:hypothetical protein